MDKDKIIQLAQDVIDTEIQAIEALRSRIDTTFVNACQHMLECQGRIVVTGMGKSGHIGGKIAATLASTGSPAFFVHPGEASHGDLGMITSQDVVLSISNSGETDELLTILPIIKRLDVPLIALTGNPDSRLAKAADAHIDISVEKEACPLGLAPTSSTTATLVMGDALAVSLLESRGFTKDDFARSHPAGRLGKRLLLRIKDIMHSGDALPQVRQDMKLRDALVEMTQKGLGMTTIVDAEQKLIGVFTDGDLRRVLDHGKIDVNTMPINECMTAPCLSITEDKLAAEALHTMEQKKINALPVIDMNQTVIGAINMHDLLRAGVV